MRALLVVSVMVAACVPPVVEVSDEGALRRRPPAWCTSGVTAGLVSTRTPYTTLQGALDDAGAGDRIYVCPGTYTERAIIPNYSDVAIIGVTGDAADVVWDGEYLHSSIDTSSAQSNPRLEVRNMSFTRYDSDSLDPRANPPLHLLSGNNSQSIVVVDNVNFTDITGSYGSYNTFVAHANRINVNNCNFDSISTTAFHARLHGRDSRINLSNSNFIRGYDDSRAVSISNAALRSVNPTILIDNVTVEENDGLDNVGITVELGHVYPHLVDARVGIRNTTIRDNTALGGHYLHVTSSYSQTNVEVSVFNTSFEDNLAMEGSIAHTVTTGIGTGGTGSTTFRNVDFLRNELWDSRNYTVANTGATETYFINTDFGLGADDNISDTEFYCPGKHGFVGFASVGTVPYVCPP
jgi:hypothetical protein